MYELSEAQLDLIQRPLQSKIFLQGPSGCGKTTVGVERLLFLMEQGVSGNSILLLVPQRTLAAPYTRALSTPGVAAGGMATVLTIGGLARRMIELFWPLVAEPAGFAQPDQPPTFLTLETAQYFMAHLVRPLLDEGFFSTVTIQPNRLYSQILDNLNKSAAVGFAHTEISQRLNDAWGGDPGQRRVYEDAQACANLFRQYCLEHNLLDFSLQLELFRRYLWNHPLCRDHLHRNYRHLLVDNLEEDIPVTHDLIGEWLPDFDSALLIYDHDGGYRRFLGADPVSAEALRALCTEQALFTHSYVSSSGIQKLNYRLVQALTPPGRQPLLLPEIAARDGDPGEAVVYAQRRFYPEMLDWVANEITRLVKEEGVPPGEVAVLAPYLPDALRFALSFRLEIQGIPTRSHRPSRALRDEPAVRGMLTLTCLAHPSWGISPSRFDVAYALLQVIQGMDLVRAQLLTEIVYRRRQGQVELSPFELIKPEVQERITYQIGSRYETLRLWLAEYAQGEEEELDVFLSRLFGEVLSQPGFGFHADYSAGEIIANLVESAQKFRWAAGSQLAKEGIPLGREYLLMVQDGVIASQYLRSWINQPEEAVLLSPAYTFLMSNRPVDYQFWLDAGSQGWFERLYQPLTHPYVLSRQWQKGKAWTDVDETEASQASLLRLASGLLRRCRKRVYFAWSDLGEAGFEQRGLLLRGLDRALRGANLSTEGTTR